MTTTEISTCYHHEALQSGMSFNMLRQLDQSVHDSNHFFICHVRTIRVGVLFIAPIWLYAAVDIPHDIASMVTTHVTDEFMIWPSD